MPWIGRISDINNFDAIAEKAAAVEIILTIRGLVDLRLEEIVIIGIMMRDNLHIFDIPLIPGTFCIEFCCHFVLSFYDICLYRHRFFRLFHIIFIITA